MRRSLYVLMLLLVGSGVLALYAEFLLATQDDIFQVAWAHANMALHGTVAMVALILLGMIGQAHVLPRWQGLRNRRSGIWLGAVLALLALSGAGLYYLRGDTVRDFNEWLHLATGFVLPILLCWHARERQRT
ncbi:MAG: hypothetical protein Q8J78_16080 [Moraxellaceae bacterium]|nr:hypothetical protein [Moraxellaceae bacterium]